MFKNIEHQKYFDEHGFFLAQLLNDDQVKDLYAFYEETKSMSQVSKPFFTSIWSKNKNYRAMVDAKLKEVLVPQVENILSDFQPVFANFMVKASGENSLLQPHQDWTFVDERKYDSYTIWIPLIDVDEYNGALGICRQSHNINNYVRSRFGKVPFASFKDQIHDELIETVPMKAGSVLFVNNRLIHASHNNWSGKERIACVLVAAPKKADLMHFVTTGSNLSDTYKLDVTPDFFVDYDCFEELDLSKAELIETEDKDVSFQDLKNLARC